MKTYSIFFSPTGGTKKVMDILANGIGQEVEKIDLIKDKLKEVDFNKDDLCLIGVPSYGGRVPSVVVDMFKDIKGNGARAVLVVVFGNRAIDDTLVELQDVLEASSFVCAVGVEAVAEHSLMHQFGSGRPDKEDERELLSFAKKIVENTNTSVKFPGNRPYVKYDGVPLKPVVNKCCTSCGLCARECPVGAISLDNPKITDNKKCISCMHCVAICPNKARSYSKLLTSVASLAMKKACSERKENKLYI